MNIDVNEFLARTDISDEAKARVRKAGEFSELEREGFPAICTEKESRTRMQVLILFELYEMGRLRDVMSEDEESLLVAAWKAAPPLDSHDASIYTRVAALA